MMTDEEIDKLAQRAKNDAYALGGLMEAIRPLLENMAIKQVSYDTVTVVEEADYVQIGYEAILECLSKWNGDLFKHYVAKTASEKMRKHRLVSWQPFSASSNANNIENCAYHLRTQLGRDPTIEEIYQFLRAKESGKRTSASRRTITAALEAAQPVQHLDFVGDQLEPQQRKRQPESRLAMEDDYFIDKDEPEGDIPIQDERLKHLIRGATPHQKKFINCWIQSDGDWETIRCAMGYKTVAVAKNVWIAITELLSNQDQIDPVFLKRVALSEALDRLHEDPALLDALPPRTRLYIEGAMQGRKTNEIAREYKVKPITVQQVIAKVARDLA